VLASQDNVFAANVNTAQWPNGAGTASGVTFTNAPGTGTAKGNPTKWLPIDDNGTTRYIPCW